MVMAESGLRKGVALWVVLVGLGLMFAASMAYRVNNPSLARVNEETPAPRGIGQEQGGMAAGMGQAEIAAVAAQMARLKEDPNSLDALLTLGDIFIQGRQPAEALKFLNRARKVNDKEPRVYYLMGLAEFGEGHFAEAANNFESLIAITPEPAAEFSLAILYRHYLSKKEQGDALLRKVIDTPDASEDLRDKARQELARPAQ